MSNRFSALIHWPRHQYARGSGGWFSTFWLLKKNWNVSIFRTLKNKIYQWIATTGRFDYSNKLQQIVESYNHQWHKAFPKGIAPVDAVHNVEKLYNHLYGERWEAQKHLRFTFSINQKVRIGMLPDQFTKSYKFGKWSMMSTKLWWVSVCVFHHVEAEYNPFFQKRVPSRPPRYRIQSISTSVMVQASFYREELQAVPDETIPQMLFKPKRILRTRRNKTTGEEEVLIDFDAPTKHVEWVSKSLLDTGHIIGEKMS